MQSSEEDNNLNEMSEKDKNSQDLEQSEDEEMEESEKENDKLVNAFIKQHNLQISNTKNPYQNSDIQSVDDDIKNDPLYSGFIKYNNLQSKDSRFLGSKSKLEITKSEEINESSNSIKNAASKNNENKNESMQPINIVDDSISESQSGNVSETEFQNNINDKKGVNSQNSNFKNISQEQFDILNNFHKKYGQKDERKEEESNVEEYENEQKIYQNSNSGGYYENQNPNKNFYQNNQLYPVCQRNTNIRNNYNIPFEKEICVNDMKFHLAFVPENYLNNENFQLWLRDGIYYLVPKEMILKEQIESDSCFINRKTQRRSILSDSARDNCNRNSMERRKYSDDSNDNE